MPRLGIGLSYLCAKKNYKHENNYNNKEQTCKDSD